MGARGLSGTGGAFGLWALAGALCALTILGILSIGIFVAPFAVVATVAAVWHTTRTGDALGAPAGIALLVAALLALN